MVKNRHIPLEQRLALLDKALKKLKSKGIITSYGLIGGFAVSALGIPRATKDIDFLVSTDDAQVFLGKLKEALSQTGFTLIIEKPEGEEFPFYVIICYRGRNERIADILIGTKKWHNEIAGYTVNVGYKSGYIPVVNTEGMIILKLKAGSPMDIIDVQNMIKSIDVSKLEKNRLMDWAKRSGTEKHLLKLLNLT